MYTSGIKTNLVSPSFNKSNYRSEFRLESDKVYLSNFRLANVGASTSVTGQQYNGLCGVYGIIRNISLLDDNIELDKINQCNMWLAFKNYNNDNSKNKDINTNLVKSNLGYTMDENVINNYIEPAKTTDNASTTAKGWLDLRDVFPMLKGSEIVPTNIFKNLRLVIEYDPDSTNVLEGSTATATSTEPLLIVDELVNDKEASKLMRGYKGLRFFAIENDIAVLPAITVSQVEGKKKQKEIVSINGFNNKVLHRLLIVNTPSDVTGLEYGSMGSLQQKDQTVQLRLNGSNILPANGITNVHERLALLNDTFGTCNTNPDKLKNSDYFGIVVQDRVQELVLEYAREGVYNENSYNQMLQLHVFGEVVKEIKVFNGRYVVGYV